ncbi:MAG: hypothetical protein ACOZQL_28300 [Myxococcota bacterium]
MKSRTWLVIALVGGLGLLCCAGGGALMLLGAAGEATSAASASGGGGATGLEGAWINGSASMTTYQSLVTGEFAPPSGTGMIYEFDGDGSCRYYGMLQSTVYSCTSWIFLAADECSWSLDGAALQVELKAGTTRSRMCGGEVKDGALKPNTHHYQARRVVEDGRPFLLLSEDGAELRFRPAN